MVAEEIKHRKMLKARGVGKMWIEVFFWIKEGLIEKIVLWELCEIQFNKFLPRSFSEW